MRIIHNSILSIDRYIEIFRSTAPEVRRAMLFYRPSSFDRNNRNSGGGSTAVAGGGGAAGPRSTTGRNSGRNFRGKDTNYS